MTEIQVRLEVDRVRNVVEAFGWKLMKDERIGSKVLLTLEKEIEFPELDTDKGAS